MPGPGEETGLSEDQANDRDMAALDIPDEGNEPSDDYQREAPRREPEDDPEAYLRPDDAEERPSRAERRRERVYRSEAERTRDSDRIAALEAELRSIRQPPPPAVDVNQALADLGTSTRQRLSALQQQELDLQRYAARAVDANGQSTLTQQEVDGLLQRKLDIEFERGQVNLEHHTRARELSAPRQPAPEMQHLHNVYADVARDPLGAASAQTYYLKQLRAGRQDSLALAEEAYQAARADMRGERFVPAGRRREAPAPSAQSRARFTGTGTGGATGSGQGRGVTTISKEEDQLAQVAYKHVKDPAERRRLYVKNVKQPSEREEAQRRRT
jgi:hypothetical protein